MNVTEIQRMEQVAMKIPTEKSLEEFKRVALRKQTQKMYRERHNKRAE